MASIKKHTCKDGTETWRVRYRNDGASSSTTFPSQDDAEQFAQMVDRWGAKRALDFISQPTEPRHTSSGVTVADCVTGYIALKPNHNTRATYTRTLKTAIEPTLGQVQIGRLQREDIQRWLNGQDGATATLRRNHRLLAGALGEAARRGEIMSNPATGVAIPRRPRNELRAALAPPFSREECELIRKAMNPRYQLMVEFLIETGCRFGEAAALTPADINLARGTVHFSNSYSPGAHGVYALGNTKTEGSDRIIRVKQSLLEKLDLSSGFLFTTLGGERVKGNAFRSAHWSKALKNSGLPKHRHGHPHDIRHAHATWLLDAGISLPAIQKRLGHASVMTTLGMYGHPGADSEERILSALD